MLQAFRDKAMGVLGWVIIGLIIITFALFGLGSYMQDKSQLFAAKVNGAEIHPRELQLAYQQQREQMQEQMQEMLGGAYDPALLDEKMIRQRALDSLVSKQLLLQASADAGMAISDQLLAARIQSLPVFQEEGEFSQERYQRLLLQQGQSPAGFEYETRRSLRMEQLLNGLSRTVFVTDAELEQAYRLQEQTRDFSYWIIAAEPFQASVEIGDAQIEEYYQQHGDEFMVPERARVAYLRLTGAELASTVEVDESELQAQYEARREALKTQEQRRASHILIEVAADADQETLASARAEAQDLLTRISEGADFAQLAEQYSDDPGSAAQGGDLGFFGKGVMASEFEASVFALQPGEVSELVQTQFGFHIIKLNEVRGGEVPALDAVREELLAELRQRGADDLFYDQLERLTDLSYENPDSLDVAAEALGLEIQTSGWLSAGGGEGIGQYPELLAQVFSEDVLEAGNNSEPVEVGGNDVIVARVEEREAAHRQPLEAVKEQIVTALRQQLAAEQARLKGAALLEQLAEGGAPEDIEEQEYLTSGKAEAVKRSASDHNAEVLREVFKLTRPKQGDSVDKGFVLSDGSYAVVHLTAVSDGDPGAMADTVREQLGAGYKDMRRGLAVATLLADLRQRADIVIPEEQE
jgi:peptidyl-prolyl cis-trans isomerase D